MLVFIVRFISQARVVADVCMLTPLGSIKLQPAEIEISKRKMPEKMKGYRYNRV
jgi:hypothetical protein